MTEDTSRLIRDVALLLGLASLVAAVVRVRRPGTFPLATLLRGWFAGLPDRRLLALAAFGGVAPVAVVPLVAAAGGWAKFVRLESPSARWVALALAGVAVKAVFVVFEELIFRGALLSLARQWVRPVPALVAGAAIFAAAHVPRPLVDLAILWIDGIGFGVAFLATERLWVPVAWHLGKNLSVWLLLGSGTIDLARGPLTVTYAGPAGLLGSSSGGGLLDLAAAAVAVGLVSAGVVRFTRRARATSPLDGPPPS